MNHINKKNKLTESKGVKSSYWKNIAVDVLTGSFIDLIKALLAAILLLVCQGICGFISPLWHHLF